jgi:hypothetical protein
VDEAELVLWIARAPGKRARGFQSKPRAKKSKAVKELNGFVVAQGRYTLIRNFALAGLDVSLFASASVSATMPDKMCFAPDIAFSSAPGGLVTSAKLFGSIKALKSPSKS